MWTPGPGSQLAQLPQVIVLLPAATGRPGPGWKGSRAAHGMCTPFEPLVPPGKLHLLAQNQGSLVVGACCRLQGCHERV